MKFQFSIIGLAGFIVVSCEDFKKPMTSSSFDPLAPPGSMLETETSYGPEFSPGQFVSAAVNNTAFYHKKPKGTEEADQLIAQGTQMKIVEVASNHLKVELDSGEVGWVPQVMVMSGTAASEMIPVDGVYQVYPPIPGGIQIEPLPVIDADGLPPEGAIPAIIDPDAPIGTTPLTLDPVPDIQPIAPVEPEGTSETPETSGEGAEATEDEESPE